MDSVPVNAFDLVIIAVLLISGVIAFFRGFVHEVLAIAAWAGAALAALYGLPHVRPVAREYIPLTWAADLAAGSALFLGVLLVLALITRALSRRVQNSALGALDRSLGFLFGLVRGAFVVAVAFVVVTWIWPEPDDRPRWIAEARGLPLVEDGAELVRSLIPESMEEDAERVRTSVREAEDLNRQVRDAQPLFERMTQPRTADPSDGSAPETGYEAEQREELNRLMQSQTNQ